MEERRRVSRIDFKANSVIVDCETLEKFYADVINISPLGIAVKLPKGSKSLLNKDVIIVAETVIMYADVIREDVGEDGSITAALSARRFTNEVLSYLFERISLDEDKTDK